MRPLEIRTERLVISSFCERDAAALSRIVNDPGVAGMMGSFVLPFTQERAMERIRERAFRGKLGFFAAIRRNSELIGLVGIGGEPTDAAYLLGRDFWGQGYATEAMIGFLAEMFTRFDLEQVEAGSFHDNPASQHVLAKLGFVQFGEEMEQSKARLEPTLCFKYRLTCEAFAQRKH